MSAMTEGEYRYNMLIKTFASAPSPAFETKGQQEAVWGRQWGCANDVGRLRTVLMHRPGDELAIVDPAKRIEALGAYGDTETGWYWRGARSPISRRNRRSTMPSSPPCARRGSRSCSSTVVRPGG